MPSKVSFHSKTRNMYSYLHLNQCNLKKDDCPGLSLKKMRENLKEKFPCLKKKINFLNKRHKKN